MITASTWLQQWSLSRKQFKASQWTGISSYEWTYRFVSLKEYLYLINPQKAKTIRFLAAKHTSNCYMEFFEPQITNVTVFAETTSACSTLSRRHRLSEATNHVTTEAWPEPDEPNKTRADAGSTNILFST